MKKNFLKKVFSVALVGVMALSLTACAGFSQGSTSDNGSESTESDSGEKKVIKFFHRFPDEPFNGFIEAKIAEYETDHPDIDIVVESAQNDAYKEKIKVVVAGEDAPDIFFSWCGEFSECFLREDLIMDLTPYLEEDAEWKDSLMESQLINYTKDDVTYGIPFRLDAKVFFYNTEIFDKYGLEAPETWDEFLNVCQTLKDEGVVPIAYGNQEKWPAAHYIGTLNQLLVSNEVRAVDYEPTTGAFTDPGYEEALNYYQELVPYFNDSANGITADMSRSTFSAGGAAIYYAELIEIPYITDSNAELKYGMFNFPLVEGAGDPTILTGAPEGFVVSANTEYPDECVEFLKWFLGPEVGKEQAQEIGWFNASKGVTEGVTDEKLIDGYNIITSAEKMGPWFDNVLYSTVCDEYLTQISDITNGDVSPADAMAKIRKIAEEAQGLAASSSEGK